LIVLNNLDSGNLTLTVYNHDGAHFNEVSSFNFYSKTMVFFFFDDSIVFGFNWKHIIHLLQMEQNALRSKTQITGGRIKIPEEDFRN
jgi:hypothetical protein